MNKSILITFALVFLCCCNARLFAQNPSNPGKFSAEQREKFIQRASKLRAIEDYGAAIVQLDSILMAQPEDGPALLFKGDLLLQAKRFGEAGAAYRRLLSLNYEPIISKINLSYALFMNHHPAKALGFARMAWEEDKSNKNAIVNYFNAMLWNIQTVKAAAFLKENEHLLDASQVRVLKARLFTTSGNYAKGLANYDSLVRQSPNKYFVQEYAEVLMGKKEFEAAAVVIEKDSALFSANEYRALNTKMKVFKRQNAGTEFVYFKDVAENVRIENMIWWQQGDGHVYRFGARTGVARITSAQGGKINAEFLHLNVIERWSKAWSGQTDIHLQRIQPESSKPFFGLTGKQLFQYQPNDRRMIGLSYSSEILNYTASLLEKNIRSSNFGYVTHLMMGGKTGFYSQGSYGFLTDKNQNIQFFGSVYRLLRTEPTLKMGLNFSAVHYKDQTVVAYFSPNRYLSSEIFVDYSTPLPALAKFYLQLQGGAGFQQIEHADWESAFRLQPEIGFRLNHFESSIKYQTSNVASSSGTGYKFNWYTLKFAWRW